jgi:hypothetical protein
MWLNGCRMEADTPQRPSCKAAARSSSEQPEQMLSGAMKAHGPLSLVNRFAFGLPNVIVVFKHLL